MADKNKDIEKLIEKLERAEIIDKDNKSQEETKNMFWNSDYLTTFLLQIL